MAYTSIRYEVAEHVATITLDSPDTRNALSNEMLSELIDAFGAALMYRNVPRKKTNELLLLGERLSTEEAREVGIVNKVVPAGELDSAVAEWAQTWTGR